MGVLQEQRKSFDHSTPPGYQPHLIPGEPGTFTPPNLLWLDCLFQNPKTDIIITSFVDGPKEMMNLKHQLLPLPLTSNDAEEGCRALTARAILVTMGR
jgi:hypothetical protein